MLSDWVKFSHSELVRRAAKNSDRASVIYILYIYWLSVLRFYVYKILQTKMDPSMNDLLGSSLRILLGCWDVIRKRSKCLVYKLKCIMNFD